MKMFWKKERGAPEDAEKVNFKKIIDILNYSEQKPDSQRKDNQASNNFMATGITPLIASFEDKKITPILCKEYASFLNSNLDYLGDNKEIIPDENSIEIVIKNLCLSIEERIVILFNPSFSASFRIHFIFKNNTFLGKVERHNNKKYYHNIDINLYGVGSIVFENNEFKDAPLNFDIEDPNKSKLDPTNDVPRSKDVILENNKIEQITTPPYSKISFKSRNEIEKMHISESSRKSDFGINWTPHQKINIEGHNVGVNRDSFIVLKGRAVRKNDKMQEIFLNREILKCDHHLTRQEPFWKSLQDRAIMNFGWLISNHGISLIRPFLWLLSINALLTLIVFDIRNPFDEQEFWAIFMDMFNPLSNLSTEIGNEMNQMKAVNYGKILYCLTEEFIIFKDDMAEWIVNYGKAIILTINIIHKVVLALLVYEMIRVGRRFTPQ